MKGKFLAAALAGCLLLTNEPAEARHLAEQQAQRLEEILGVSGAMHRRHPAPAWQAQQEEENARRRAQEERARQAELERESQVPVEEDEQQAVEEAEAAAEKAGLAEAEPQSDTQTEAQRLTTSRMNREREARGAREKAREAEQAAAGAEAETVAEEAVGEAAEEEVTFEVKEALVTAAEKQEPEPPPPAEEKAVETGAAQPAEKAETQPEDKTTAKPEKKKERKKKQKHEKEEAAQTAKPQQASVAANKAEHPAAKKRLKVKPLEVDSIDGGGTLLFSSSPEYVKEPGVLYADMVRGDARALYYHVNETGKPCKMLVVLHNEGSKSVTVRLTRGAAAKPSADYLKVGRDTQLAYFGQPLQDEFKLAAGERRLLRPEMEKIILQPDDLVYGVYDFSTTEMVRVSFVLCPVTEQSLVYSANAPVLKRAAENEPSAGRGTFVGMNRVMTCRQAYHPKKNGPAYFMLGNDEDDLFVNGIDATDGSIATNYGNYGINYYIRLPLAAGASVRTWLQAVGGVYTGAVCQLQPDGSFGKMLPTPAGQNFMGAGNGPAPSEAEEDGILRLLPTDELEELPLDGKGPELAFVFSPPGASNLPVRLILTSDLAKK